MKRIGEPDTYFMEVAMQDTNPIPEFDTLEYNEYLLEQQLKMLEEEKEHESKS